MAAAARPVIAPSLAVGGAAGLEVLSLHLRSGAPAMVALGRAAGEPGRAGPEADGVTLSPILRRAQLTAREPVAGRLERPVASADRPVRGAPIGLRAGPSAPVSAPPVSPLPLDGVPSSSGPPPAQSVPETAFVTQSNRLAGAVAAHLGADPGVQRPSTPGAAPDRELAEGTGEERAVTGEPRLLPRGAFSPRRIATPLAAALRELPARLANSLLRPSALGSGSPAQRAEAPAEGSLTEREGDAGRPAAVEGGLGTLDRGQADPPVAGVVATAPPVEPVEGAAEAPRAREASHDSLDTPPPPVDDDRLSSPALSRLQEVELRLRDTEGDIRVAVRRQGEGLGVHLQAPRSLVPELRELRAEVGAELAQDGHQLDSYDATPDPDEGAPDPEGAPRPGQGEAPSAPAATPSRGRGQVINRVV